MPSSAPTACVVPGCPRHAIRKGRCEVHRQTRDGYSPTWRRTSEAVRRAAGRCSRCGATTDLTTDHVVPAGGDQRSNLRVLCRRCHAIIGAKR